MAREQQDARHVVPVSGDSPPDLHWPMDVSLILLGSVLMGTAAYYQHFDDPRWTHNTWTSLVVISIAVWGSFIASRWVSGRWIRRSMQFAVLVSLLVHLAFLVATWRISVPAKPWTRTMRLEEVVRQRPRRTAPDHVRHQLAHQQVQPDFARPVETTSPSPLVEPVQRTDLPEQAPQEFQLESVADPEPMARPSPIVRPEPGESLPRQSEESGQLSRNSHRHQVPLPMASRVPNSFPVEPAAPPPSLSAPPIDAAKAKETVGPSLQQPREITLAGPQPQLARLRAERSIRSQDPSLDSAERAGLRPTRVARSIAAETPAPIELPEVESTANLGSRAPATVAAPTKLTPGALRDGDVAREPTMAPSIPVPDRLAASASLTSRPMPRGRTDAMPRVESDSSSSATAGVRRSRTALAGPSAADSAAISESIARENRGGLSPSRVDLAELEAASVGREVDSQVPLGNAARGAGRFVEGPESVVAPRSITGPVYDEQLAALEASAERRRAETGRRRRTSQLRVEVDAAAGVGGFGSTDGRNVGIDDRRARPDSPDVQTQVARFPRRQVGIQPPRNSAPLVAAEAFRQRLERSPTEAGGQQLSPETERAIELGLVYLARNQHEDGRWILLGRGEERPSMQSDSAATALSLLAFQGAGYTHQSDRYDSVVRAGLDFLLSTQQSDGSLFVEADDESNLYGRLYSHGIAALALCEAYGMTQDPQLKNSAQRAIDFIVQSQHKDLGGWRYAPNDGSDTSVTGWMMMALKSGELAGLTVPRQAYRGVEGWLNQSQASRGEPHLYRYNPLAPDTMEQRHGRRPTATMTAVGLLLRLYVGWNREDPRMQQGAAFLRANAPALGSVDETNAARRRDTYYWYYATQVMFHMGGENWRAWNESLHPLLVDSQEQEGELAGSWDPLHPVPDRWAGHAGRLYVTTLNLLSLEVAYRHLPLYLNTGK